jgi:predicted transcriptional regulator
MTVAKLIAERNAGVLVVDSGRPVGIVRQVDLAAAVAEGRDVNRTRAAEVMYTPPPVVRVGSSLREMMDVAKSAGVRVVYVSDGKEVVHQVELEEILDLVSSTWGNIDAHKALSASVRVRIAELISVRPMSVEQIAKSLGVKPVTVRHHLNVLKAGGMIEAEQLRGKVGRPTMLFRGIGLAMGRVTRD